MSDLQVSSPGTGTLKEYANTAPGQAISPDLCQSFFPESVSRIPIPRRSRTTVGFQHRRDGPSQGPTRWLGNVVRLSGGNLSPFWGDLSSTEGIARLFGRGPRLFEGDLPSFGETQVHMGRPLVLYGRASVFLGRGLVFFGRPLVHSGRGVVFLGRPLSLFGRGSVFFGRPLVFFGRGLVFSGDPSSI